MPSKPTGQETNGSLRRLRVVVGTVLAAVLAFMLLAESMAGSFGIRGDYRVDAIIVGTILAGILMILGIEVGGRWPWGGGGGGT